MNSVDPQKVLENLKQKASTRRCRSLEILNTVLECQSQKEYKDFSIVTIGKLSEEQGGPSTQTIRNKTGSHYQELISAWAVHSGTTTKKPLSKKQNRLTGCNDQELLENIDDPVLRAIFGSIIADRNRYREQLNTLKKYHEVTIDTRESQETSTDKKMCFTLNSMELIALKNSVDDEFFSRQQWLVTKAGQVKSEIGNEIYKHGYVNGIKKVIAFCESED